MTRTMKCLRYEITHAAKSVGIFLAFYIVCYGLSFWFSVLANEGNSHGESGMAAFFPFVIYLFIFVSINYSNHYNLLMTLGNTRREILTSQFVAYGIVALASAGITQILDSVAGLFFNAVHYSNLDVLTIAYRDGHDVFSRILFYFALYLAVSAVSLLLGTIRYHFGQNITRKFWIVFGLSWVFIVPLIEWLSRSNITPLINAAKFYSGYGSAHGLLQGAGNFALTAVVIGAVAWMFGRRQELIVAEKQE